jgi:O-antigen/teichoic acid export membrane protein
MATSGYLLIMSQHEKLVMGVFAAGAALNACGGLALIPRLGTTGAAASSALSLCLVSVSCALLARRKLGIDGTVFARQPREAARA